MPVVPKRWEVPVKVSGQDDRQVLQVSVERCRRDQVPALLEGIEDPPSLFTAGNRDVLPLQGWLQVGSFHAMTSSRRMRIQQRNPYRDTFLLHNEFHSPTGQSLLLQSLVVKALP
jgi:hypothetical protein